MCSSDLFNLGNGLHLPGGHDALIDLPARDFVQTARVEVRAAPVHTHHHRSHDYDAGEQTTPNPNAFALALRRHNSPVSPC